MREGRIGKGDGCAKKILAEFVVNFGKFIQVERSSCPVGYVVYIFRREIRTRHMD